jgi:4-hydroxythreonine-4-phosphate dehydrogenase
MPEPVPAPLPGAAYAPIAISMGDPAGIGPEVIAKAWTKRDEHALSPFFVIGDAEAIARVWDGPLARISTADEAIAHFANALPCLPIDSTGETHPGQPSLPGAQMALSALEAGIGLTKAGAASALVTAPVSKAALYEVGFTHPGQTEFVAERCGIAPENAVMMLAGPDLRVVPITIHIPLAQVPHVLTTELLLSRARATAYGLTRQFGIANPRIAVAGLNPHAGENGALGDEDQRIIIPAVDILRAEGMNISGPFAADTLFHARARAHYDAALCMYHDQALIPIKTLNFDEGVNMTLGLPIVRTSPDHGTAFNIAGQSVANPGAMIAAIQMAHTASRFAQSAAD